MLKVDRHSKYSDFAVFEPVLAEGMAEKIEAAAVRDRYGKDRFFSMTLGDLFDVLSGNPEPLAGDEPDTVFAVYRVRAFQRFIGNGEDNGFIAKLKALTLPPTEDTIKAAQGCLDYNFDESVYVFCRHYFNLHTFADVDGLKIADLIMAKKDAYNQGIVDRNMAAAMRKGARR